MKIFGFFLTALISWFVIGIIASFFVMLGVGNLHEWWNFIPTMGFWDAFSVTVWFSVPLAMYAGYTTTNS